MLRAGLLSVALAISSSACAPAAVDLRDVRRIETDRRFVRKDPALSPGVEAAPVVLEGDRLRALVAAAHCRRGAVLWKGGIPATLVLADGSRVQADGFSSYGGFLRIHRDQWCEIDADAWAAIWQSR